MVSSSVWSHRPDPCWDQSRVACGQLKLPLSTKRPVDNRCSTQPSMSRDEHARVSVKVHLLAADCLLSACPFLVKTPNCSQTWSCIHYPTRVWEGELTFNTQYSNLAFSIRAPNLSQFAPLLSIDIPYIVQSPTFSLLILGLVDPDNPRRSVHERPGLLWFSWILHDQVKLSCSTNSYLSLYACPDLITAQKKWDLAVTTGRTSKTKPSICGYHYEPNVYIYAHSNCR